MFSSGLQDVQTCRGCRVTLQYERDSQRNTGRLFRNCVRYREDNARRKRIRRGLRRAAANRSARLEEPVAVPLRSVDYAAIVNARNNMGNTTLSQRNLADHDRSSLNIPGFRPRTISPSSSRSTEFECTVCGDTFPASEFPQLQACSHNPRVCRECFSGWLISQVGHTS
jgi:hypothetical protein